MSKEYITYRGSISRFLSPSTNNIADWLAIYDWYTATGRDEYLRAFRKETQLRISTERKLDSLIAEAIPKGIGDLDRQSVRSQFYSAHGALCLQEMDRITRNHPRVATSSDEATLATLLGLIRSILVDSQLLFEHWATYCEKVPGVFGIGKNQHEHEMHLLQSTRQVIYGHGASGLSFVDNHSDTSIGMIRQMLELRIRRGFGILGKNLKADQAFFPVPLSDILESIAKRKRLITFPVPFENIQRIYGWCNLYMHLGLKLYAWCAPRVLEYALPFAIGGSAPGYAYSTRAGIQLPRTVILDVQNEVEALNNPGKYDIIKLTPEECDAILL